MFQLYTHVCCGNCRIQRPQPRCQPSIFPHLMPAKSSFMSSPSNDEIVVRVIEPRERQQILDFIRVHYYLEEPLTAGSEPQRHDVEDEDWNMSHIHHGTSIVALRNAATNCQRNVIGALISGPKGRDEAANLFQEAAKLGPTKMGHILQFTACLERDSNVCERFNVNRVLHVHLIAVSAAMREQNVGARLIHGVLSRAQSLHYEMVTVDCTSFYSARLFERMGFQCINIKHYRDYVDDTGEQVFKPSAPHDCVKTFALRLKAE